MQTFYRDSVWTPPRSMQSQAIPWHDVRTDMLMENPILSGAYTPRGIQVPTTGIEDDAVTSAKIAAGAVGTSGLAVEAVTDAKLAADSVTTTKILNDNVTGAKIADNAVGAAKIQWAAADTQVSVGSAGAATALPAQPTGYILIDVNNTIRAIPYYDQA